MAKKAAVLPRDLLIHIRLIAETVDLNYTTPLFQFFLHRFHSNGGGGGDDLARVANCNADGDSIASSAGPGFRQKKGLFVKARGKRRGPPAAGAGMLVHWLVCAVRFIKPRMCRHGLSGRHHAHAPHTCRVYDCLQVCTKHPHLGIGKQKEWPTD